MINLSNYRIKINLTNFYNDQRMLSYIYVDTNKITKVLGLHQKISDVFNIDQPFHLFTDESIFLPLNEDIRIIDKQDTIMVQPEFSNLYGIINQPASEKFQARKNFTKCQEFENIESKTNYRSQSESASHTDNETEVSVIEKNKANDNQSPKCDEFVNSSSPVPKRKRKRGSRGRRKKNNQTEQLPQINGYSAKMSNQSISNNCNNGYKNVSTPKHLKFDWEETTKKENINGNSTNNSHEAKPTVRSNESADLTLLLGLKNSKTPLRFVSKKVKPSPPAPLKTTSSSLKKNENIQIKNSDSPIQNDIGSKEENVNYSKINPLDYPAWSSEFQINDVIAFRTLKMGEDYSPTVSGYIIAKIISKDCIQNNYVFKILAGHDQMKIPNGKFSLPSDEENNEDTKLDESELITLNVTHLVEPRLICREKLD